MDPSLALMVDAYAPDRQTTCSTQGAVVPHLKITAPLKLYLPSFELACLLSPCWQTRCWRRQIDSLYLEPLVYLRIKPFDAFDEHLIRLGEAIEYG
jgi:hypothetical protein